MSEMWRPVPGYEDRYEISSLGRIRNSQGMERKPYSLPAGHQVIDLWKNNKQEKKYVHRLVLEVFDRPCPEGMMCRHLDGDPANNRLENLRWGTRSENALDEVVAGRHWQTRKTHCKHGHEFTPENTIWRKGGTARTCRLCNQKWQSDYAARRRAA